MNNEVLKELRSKALNSAMKLFWQRGAERTSYADIVAATALSRKALYQLWPDKNALLRESLRSYRDTILAQVMAPLETGQSDSLRQFWDQLETASQGTGWNGCLLFRTGGGPLASDPEIAGMLVDHIEKLESRLMKSIERHQSSNSTKSAIAPDYSARASVAILALISTLGFNSGYSPKVAQLYRTGRAICGIAE